MDIALAFLAINVAAVYLTIAIFVVPKINLTNATSRFEMIFRAAAISFFVGCGFSHIHIGVHAVTDADPASFHQVWMHVMQAIGGWLFIWAALRFLEIRVDRINPTIAKLEELAMRDPLTGAHNRRAFDEVLAMETAEAVRLDAPMALLMMDLDGFKQINDESGHAVGDDMLRDLVDIVRDSIRPGDTMARLGGDEFGLVLPKATRSSADIVAARIQANIAARPTDLVPISISIGIAILPHDGVDPAQLEIAADREMYKSKRQRRIGRASAPSGFSELDGAALSTPV